MDALWILATIGFFVISGLYVVACSRLGK